MKKALTAALYLSPMLLLAQELDNLGGFTEELSSLIDTLIPIVFGLALLFFLWGLAKYILASGDEDAKETGKRIMIWGIVALFVMASVWGIVGFLQGVFGVENNDINLPGAPDDGSFDIGDWI